MRVERLVALGRDGRPGPVFLEAAPRRPGRARRSRCGARKGAAGARRDRLPGGRAARARHLPRGGRRAALTALLADRPVAPCCCSAAASRAPRLPRGRSPVCGGSGVPLMTTWNGTDRVPADEPLYAGRPNTWGHALQSTCCSSRRTSSSPSAPGWGCSRRGSTGRSSPARGHRRPGRDRPRGAGQGPPESTSGGAWGCEHAARADTGHLVSRLLGVGRLLLTRRRRSAFTRGDKHDSPWLRLPV